MKKLLIISAMAAIVFDAAAQVTVKTSAGDLSLRLIGRTNVDAGTFLGDDLGVHNGVIMNDTRLGIKAAFDENWSSTIEICYTDKTVSFRDLWIGYALNEHSSFKAGNFFMPYGALQLGIAFKFAEDASADKTFCPSRKIGLAYFYTSDPLNITAGLFSDGNVDSKATDQGITLSAKAIWRPIIDNTTVLHVGFAPMFTDSPNDPSFRGAIPTTITTATLISTPAFDAENTWKFEGEALYISGRFYGEAHFLASTVGMKQGDNYSAQGIYGQAGFLLIGEQQNYNKTTGLASPASAKNLEVLARVSHINLDEYGKQTDFTVGLNYFFNKYVNLKLNYIFASVKDGDNYNVLQSRLQFSF